MALTQKSLEEPLLSRQQAAVCRDIARAAQITEALKLVIQVSEFIEPKSNAHSEARSKEFIKTEALKNYLKAEVERVLMQIKLPSTPVTVSQSVPPKTETQVP